MNNTKKLLIIDDDKNVSYTLKRMFQRDKDYDFEVHEAGSIKEADEILKNAFEKDVRRFDVVIIDWKFDKEDIHGGLKILEDLKQYLPKVKIIYTAVPEYDNCVKAIKAGADNYIIKPNLEKLLEAVKEELRLRKADKNEPDYSWYRDNAEMLYDKYRGELLAFIDGILVDHDKSKRELLKKVKEKYPDEEPYLMYAPVDI